MLSNGVNLNVDEAAQRLIETAGRQIAGIFWQRLKEGFSEKGAKAINRINSHFETPKLYNLHWKNSETVINLQKWVAFKSWKERLHWIGIESRKLVMTPKMYVRNLKHMESVNFQSR